MKLLPKFSKKGIGRTNMKDRSLCYQACLWRRIFSLPVAAKKKSNILHLVAPSPASIIKTNSLRNDIKSEIDNSWKQPCGNA